MKDYSSLIEKGCLSRNAYDSLARANMQLNKIRKVKRNKNIHVYKCQFFEHFHLGHSYNNK